MQNVMEAPLTWFEEIPDEIDRWAIEMGFFGDNGEWIADMAMDGYSLEEIKDMYYRAEVMADLRAHEEEDYVE